MDGRSGCVFDVPELFSNQVEADSIILHCFHAKQKESAGIVVARSKGMDVFMFSLHYCPAINVNIYFDTDAKQTTYDKHQMYTAYGTDQSTALLTCFLDMTVTVHL